MRKALVIAVLAATMTSFQHSSAAVETFNIAVPTPVSGTGGTGPACFGFENKEQCQKATAAIAARCGFVLSGGSSQTPAGGVNGFVLKIKTADIGGSLTGDSNYHEEDNKKFDLIVTNKAVTNQPGHMDLPDVDVSFYADLGSCPSDQTVTVPGANQDVDVPVGPTPITFEPRVHTRGSYNGYGDELNMLFPGGWYSDRDNPTIRKRAASYYAVVTIVGGANATVSFKCKANSPLNPGACPASWNSFIAAP